MYPYNANFVHNECFQAFSSSLIIGSVTISTWISPRSEPSQKTWGQLVSRWPQETQWRKWVKCKRKRNFNKVYMNKLVTTVGNWDSFYWKPNRNLMEYPSELVPRGWGGLLVGVTFSVAHYHHHPGWWLEMVLKKALQQRKHTLNLKWKAVNLPEPFTAASGRLRVAKCVGRVSAVALTFTVKHSSLRDTRSVCLVYPFPSLLSSPHHCRSKLEIE